MDSLANPNPLREKVSCSNKAAAIKALILALQPDIDQLIGIGSLEINPNI